MRFFNFKKYFNILILIIFTRIFVIELHTIPSSSMASALQTGDKIIVSKLQYGARLPRSGFEIPWLNLFWFLNPKARANMGKNEWDYKRLSGYSEIKRGDVVVFNHPGNMFEFYIKRCIALPGDTLQIINSEIFINGKQAKQENNLLHEYRLYYKNLRKVQTALDSLKSTNPYLKNLIYYHSGVNYLQKKVK